MNTLYISDLDGTLLNQEGLLSDSTALLLQELISQGVHFTCATARTAATVTKILKDLPLSAPAILMNGVAILDWVHHHYIKVEYLGIEFSTMLIKKLQELHLTSFIYAIRDDQLYNYYESFHNDAMFEFYHERVIRYQKPYTKVDSLAEVPANDMIYSLLLDKKESLLPICEWLSNIRDTYHIDYVFYPEIYLKDTWCLEIFSANASKYNAVQFIRKEYDYDRIIGFGDNLNDLSLFQACDAAYAVSNAKPPVKELATGVIGSNIEDSVPKFIQSLEKLS